MLFHSRYWPGLADGTITLAFRRWKKASVLAGRSYRTPVGLIDVQSVDIVHLSGIKPAEIARAGYTSLAELQDNLAPESEGATLFRIAFSRAERADPRTELSETVGFSDAEVVDIEKRLDKLDRASSYGAWTRETLRAIAERPAVRAGDLAASFGRETQPFKLDVRKLKNLGLTHSLEVGYRLSPRGEELLQRLD